MNGPVQTRRGRFLLLLAPFVLVSAVIPAGRSDAAEAEPVTAAEIVDGLKKIETSALLVADYAGSDKKKAQQIAAEIEPVWSKIEATVKANKADSYTAFEKAIKSVETAAKVGNATQGKAAAAALSTAVKAYAAEYPAGFGVATRSAAAAAESPEKAAAAAPAAAGRQAAANDAKPAPAPAREAAAAPAGNATLARTGPHDGIIALAGGAFGLGGLALMGGARRRRAAATA